MKINIVTGPFYPTPPAPCGAVERLWTDLAIEFAKRGHDVTVICRGSRGQRSRETRDGVEFRRRGRMKHTTSVYFDLLQDFIYCLRILFLIPRGDIVVTNTFWLPWLLRFRKPAGKIVPNISRWPKGYLKLYGHVALLAAVSSAIRDEIVRQRPVLAGRARVLSNPIDTDAFKPPPQPRRTTDAPMIVYHGRIHPEKGLHILVEAYARLRRERSGTDLKLIGESSIEGGGGGEPYKQQLRDLAGGAQVELHPPVYDRRLLCEHLQAADVYVYPSVAEQGESFGVAPLEAMATGLPAIVSNLTVFSDFLTDGENGYVFDHRAQDPAGALLAAMRRQLDYPEEARRLGRAAAERAKAFALPAIAEQFLAAFETLRGVA